MLTPTGMAEADPVADNESVEGKSQNRRVAVNILVCKGLGGRQGVRGVGKPIPDSRTAESKMHVPQS